MGLALRAQGAKLMKIEGMLLHIVDDEQRSNRGAIPMRVPGGAGHLRRWRSSTMCSGIACVAPPRICSRSARDAAPPNSRTDSYVPEVWTMPGGKSFL